MSDLSAKQLKMLKHLSTGTWSKGRVNRDKSGKEASITLWVLGSQLTLEWGQWRALDDLGLISNGTTITDKGRAAASDGSDKP